LEINEIFVLLGSEGWEHELTFYAFDEERPGTSPYGVGHAKYGKKEVKPFRTISRMFFIVTSK